MSDVSEDAQIQAIYDRWLDILHTQQFDRVAECVAPICIRHDGSVFRREPGSRQVTPETYARELVGFFETHSNARWIVHDRGISGDRLWVCWTARHTDAHTGAVHTRAAIQVYRIEDGKFAEIWVTVQDPGAWDEYEPE